MAENNPDIPAPTTTTSSTGLSEFSEAAKGNIIIRIYKITHSGRRYINTLLRYQDVSRNSVGELSVLGAQWQCV